MDKLNTNLIDKLKESTDDKRVLFFLNELHMQARRRRTDLNYCKQVMALANLMFISYSDFVQTGRMMPAKTYADDYPSDNGLLPDCTDVMRYIGGYVVQAVKSGEWVLVHGPVMMASPVIEEIEKYIYENLLCKEVNC